MAQSLKTYNKSVCSIWRDKSHPSGKLVPGIFIFLMLRVGRGRYLAIVTSGPEGFGERYEPVGITEQASTSLPTALALAWESAW